MSPETLPDSARTQPSARQKIEFRDGSEAALVVARQLGFDLGPCTPATPAAEIALCYGAALGGARVIGAPGWRSIVDCIGHLSAVARARMPMVLNLAASPGPVEGSDHSVLYQALDSGWIVLCARDPQAVYDLNLAAVKIGEHPDVRLPVLVAFDGGITSRGKRRVLVVDDADALSMFVGPRPRFLAPIDLARPSTFGAPRNPRDLADDSVRRSKAMEAARGVIAAVFADLERLTGRTYAVLDAYAMGDAEAAVVLLNSAAETARLAVDVWREEGRKVGVLSPNVLRPFPAQEIRDALRGVKAAAIGDRADCSGTEGGRIALEIRAAIQADGSNDIRLLSRVYGLAGTDFHATDAEELLDEAFNAARTADVREPFAYQGSNGRQAAAMERDSPAGLPPLRTEEVSRGMARITRDEASGRLRVELEPLWKMTSVPSRIAPGHCACPGCGIFPMLHQVYRVLEGDVVALFESGCAMAASAAHSWTAHRINCVHDTSGNGAATLAGLVEASRRAGGKAGTTFLMITGDGAMEAGLAAAVGAARRGHRMIILEYDNQGRMSEGGAATASTPPGHPADTARLFAACDLPYVFTASEGYPEDLMRKAAKAQWYARNEGLAYGRVLSFCPLNWQAPDDGAETVLQTAVDSCFFPIYEVEKGHTTITYDPDAVGRRKPVAEWLKLLGRSRRLLDPAHAEALARIQAETDRRWARLKAMHEHPLL